MTSRTDANRRRFLALSLPLAALPLLPPLSSLLATAFSRAVTGEAAQTDDFTRPYALRHSPSAVAWLEEHLRQRVRPDDFTRVRAAAMTIDELYPFFWVSPSHIPDFATVFFYLEHGELPVHRRGLKRWHCGLCEDGPEKVTSFP
ncbi:MAG: hypothetical protein LBD06_12490 [Candidatus Accumulibacter sp.]|jgi:hypothetical protein|nr:hypothetical protein [Accumulibacter sp.]